MKVFLSWSGDMSRELAEILREWLPAVLQSVKPYFTPSDIEKGARWNKDISKELEESAVGIFCLTKENLLKPWIMFEAGALSKSVDVSLVCPVLFGVDSTDLEGPLVQFQASSFCESDMRRLMKTFNSSLNENKLEDSVLMAVFDKWWSSLDEKVTAVMEKYATTVSTTSPIRSDRELLEEVLQISRLNTLFKDTGGPAPGFVDPAIMLYAMRNLLTICERAVDKGYKLLIPEIKNLFDALRFVVRQASFIQKDQARLDEVILKLESILQ